MQLVVSDRNGKIYNVPNLEATGMKGGFFLHPGDEEFIKLPPGSELFTLPNRVPVGYDQHSKRFVTLDRHFAVAAFISPGFTTTYNSSYREISRPKILPLFSYAACAFYKGEFYVTAIKVDGDRRHDSRFIDIRLVRKNIVRFRKIFPKNRLVRHLEACALVYGCPNAQNFFLNRYEAPLPTSPDCNAFCAGCISYQPNNNCPVTQPRIKFIPTPEEIAEIALFHIAKVDKPIVSFGQGCEGEPLLAGDILEKTILIIRRKTVKGLININTNASMPKVISKLFNIGLDSIRVSLNSVREEYYTRYYKPRGYIFNDVMNSIKIARSKKGFISINYLTMPGFTDFGEEFIEFKKFISNYRINMIQWRNLNFDPLRYFKILKVPIDVSKMLGIREIIKIVKEEFSNVKMGYFNPYSMR